MHEIGPVYQRFRRYLATHEFDLEDAPRGYELFKHKEEGRVRPVFTP